MAAGNGVFIPYATLPTAAAFREAASQATPELTNENVQMTQLVTRAVEDVVPMWASLHGQSSGDAMVYQPGKVWLKPYGATMNQNEHNSVNGFYALAYGAVVGKDVQLTDDWLFGGAFAAGGDNIRGRSFLSGQSIQSNEYQGMVYAAKKLSHHYYFAGQALLGYGNNNTRRTIPIDATTANGSYDSWFTNLRAELGQSLYALNQNLVITPELDVSYLFINQGGYQEFALPWIY